MPKFWEKNHRLIFYTAWLALNIVQACYTELFDDEAYYWVYSNFPAWGYFDHPPMIAVLIRAGYTLFHNELGVRLFIVLMNIGTFLIVQRLLEKKNDFLFYGVVVSIAVAQIAGFMAVPDIPVLFFTALFFWLYRRFVQQMNFINTMLLGICMALMLYSKYHAILIILFTFLSNLKLFTRYQTWLAAGVGLLLFGPHLYWQYSHDFISVKFHLFERNSSRYSIIYPVEFILGQLALAGPVIGWLLLWGAYRHQPASPTEKALRFSFAGIFILFFFSTIKGRVEANWTLPAFIPLIVLSHQYLAENARMRKWLYRSLPVTLLLIIPIRIYMMMDVPPIQGLSKDEMHYNTVWTGAIEQQAGDLPVVFFNSYQQPSKYWFYTKHPAFSLNSAFYRRNNFNIWPVEDSLIGQTAYINVPRPDDYYLDFFRRKGWKYPESHISDNFYSFSKVDFTGINVITDASGTQSICAIVHTPPGYTGIFQQSPYASTSIWLAVYKDDKVADLVNTGITLQQITEPRQLISIPLPASLEAGNYKVRICIGSSIEGFPTMNSMAFTFTI